MYRKLKILLFLKIFYLFFFYSYAGEKSMFKVIPWNGYSAAVSLTFDDGDPPDTP